MSVAGSAHPGKHILDGVFADGVQRRGRRYQRAVEVRFASGRAIRLGALSPWRFPRQRLGWRATALTELEAILAAHQREY
jgi:hypothetical protein